METDLDRLLRTASRPVAARNIAGGDFSGYEKDSHRRTPPPGIPLGYVLEVTTCTCSHCGSKAATSRLFQIVRAGLSTARLGIGPSSIIFDRPISRFDRTEATPVCLACVEDLRPEPVPYPVPGAAIGLRKSNAEVERLTGRPAAVRLAPVKVAVADVLDDFA